MRQVVRTLRSLNIEETPRGVPAHLGDVPARSLTVTRTVPVDRPAYTLLELILVVALIGILAALSVPAFNAMRDYYRQEAAVDSVRTGWAKARAHAIREGVPYRFAVVLNQGQFRIAPDQVDYWEGGRSTGDTPQTLVLEETLPKGVTFALSDGNAPPPPIGVTPGRLKAGSPSGTPQDEGETTASVSPGQYTPLIVFQPDGTAEEDVSLLLQLEGSRTRLVRLRALTGAVTVRTLDEGEAP